MTKKITTPEKMTTPVLDTDHRTDGPFDLGRRMIFSCNSNYPEVALSMAAQWLNKNPNCRLIDLSFIYNDDKAQVNLDYGGK